MAKRAGLPWDCVISAELFRHYKPFVARPLERGPARPLPEYSANEFDFTATDFLDLAEQLDV